MAGVVAAPPPITFDNRCMLEWDEDQIRNWLISKRWDKYIVALSIPDGEVLATRDLDSFVDAVRNKMLGKDMWKAAGRVLDDHSTKFDIPKHKLKRFLIDRGDPTVLASKSAGDGQGEQSAAEVGEPTPLDDNDSSKMYRYKRAKLEEQIDENMPQHQITHVKNRYRCNLCCQYKGCEDGASEPHYLSGRKTQFGCKDCFASIWLTCKNKKQKKVVPGEYSQPAKTLSKESLAQSERHIFALCNKARYAEHGDTRTCFQIHHQDFPNYPPYVACNLSHKRRANAAAKQQQQ